MDDIEAWKAYSHNPEYRKWFNKLEVGTIFGHYCGPIHAEVPFSGKYIVRPIYNLWGMGAGAQVCNIKKGEPHDKFPPGSFWQLYIDSPEVHTADLVYKDSRWTIDRYSIGHRSSVQHFTTWTEIDPLSVDLYHQIPELSKLDVLKDIPIINIEFIKNRIIEVHLRHNPNPRLNPGESMRVL